MHDYLVDAIARQMLPLFLRVRDHGYKDKIPVIMSLKESYNISPIISIGK